MKTSMYFNWELLKMIRIHCLVYTLLLSDALAFRDRQQPLNPQYENMESCSCVPPHMCGDNDIAVNGQGLLDVRLDPGECPNFNDICCDSLLTDVVESHPLPVSTFKGCGYQNPTGMIPRITSDSENSQFGELPWSVAILVRDMQTTERNMFQCGGSLIHPQVVLTAAHCVSDINFGHLTIRVGEWDTKSQEELLPHQDRSVKEVTLHPRYNPGSLRNDIAIIYLSDPVILAGNVGVICLPPMNLKMVKGKCIASGWGKESFKSSKHSNILKKVQLPLVPRNQCLKLLRNTRLGGFYNLHRSFICAGGEKNKDTCKGDGGSPLVCPIDKQPDRFVLMGIVSWGIGCGEQTPGVYVNVQLYSDWIDKQLYAKNFDGIFYKF